MFYSVALYPFVSVDLQHIHYIAKSIGTPSNEQVWLL